MTDDRHHTVTRIGPIGEPKCTESDLKKFPDLSHLGANLTFFGSKSGHRASPCSSVKSRLKVAGCNVVCLIFMPVCLLCEVWPNTSIRRDYFLPSLQLVISLDRFCYFPTNQITWHLPALVLPNHVTLAHCVHWSLFVDKIQPAPASSCLQVYLVNKKEKEMVNVKYRGYLYLLYTLLLLIYQGLLYKRTCSAISLR